ncbi:hypothetical protein BGZ68_008200, partial [Mortierella alpina]
YLSSGRRLASCSGDGTVRLWDVVSGGCLMSMNDLDKPIRSLAWKESDSGSYLATSNGEMIRVWQVTEKEGKPHLRLQWSSPQTSLDVKGANFQDAHGLNRLQIQLLKQRDSVGKPIPPLSIRTAGKKLISMAAAVDRLSLAPKKELSNDPAEEPIAGEAELEASQKGGDLAVEE